MTASTVKAEFSVVHVVGPMAVTAATTEPAQRGERLTVAIITGNRDMGTIQ